MPWQHSKLSSANGACVKAFLLTFAFSAFAGVACAQPNTAGSPFDLGLGGGSGLGGVNTKVTASAKVVGGGGSGGTLHVTLDVAKGFHVYSITQKDGGPKITAISVTKKPEYRLAGQFVAQNKPEVHEYKDIWPGLPIEEHHGSVTWVAPVAYEAGADPAKTVVEGVVRGQVCDENSCEDFAAPFTATYEKPSGTPGEMLVGVAAKVVGKINAAAAAPGDKVSLRLDVEPNPGWHTYVLSDQPVDETKYANKATLVSIHAPDGFKVARVTAGSPEVKDDGLSYYDGPVAFSTIVEIPKSAKTGEVAVISGTLGFQVCRGKGSCDSPRGVQFTFSLSIESAVKSGETPATFSVSSYDEAVKDAKASAAKPLDMKEFLTIIGSSLLGGLILNLMPCVLPVIGLKVLSFVEQAHHDRRQVLSLNLWYSLGLMLVFIALATASFLLNKGWGEQFTSTWFNVALSGIVFAMALSFLGVWEIPIPGFVGSGRAGELAQREGRSGAFAKGILTTVLATPCSGPFLGAVFAFTLNRPAYVVYTIFASVGLGMASPYLLIGFYPKLIRFLPKPGAWMETFKQAMGFVLLGTVVFLFTFIDKNYLVPTFALLMAIWAGCWWIGKVPLTAEFPQKATGWATGLALAAVLGGGAFAILRPAEPILPWKNFTVSAVNEAKAQGKTVMIDFSADWCLTCKTNLKLAVDTKKTLEVVQKNGVVPFLADWTKESDEIKTTLNALGSNSIPVLAIFPANDPGNPIILRDLLSQDTVIKALEQAGPSKNNATADVPAKSTAAN